MSLKTSVLKNQMMKGQLSQMTSGKQAAKKKAPLVFALNLTALIDAFSMLVIFLLTNMSADSTNINMSNKIKLPVAVASEASGLGYQIRVEGNSYFVEDKAVSIDGLAGALVQLKKKSTSPDMQSIIITADQQLSYDMLSPILKAGGQAGFQQFKFAVLQSSKRAGL